MASLAARLKAALADRRISAAELARRLDADSGLVSKWLNGKQEPGAESLAAICGALGLSGHWLLTEQGSMDAPNAPPGDVRAQAVALARAEVRETLRVVIAEALRDDDEPEATGAASGGDRPVPQGGRAQRAVNRAAGAGKRRRTG